MMLFMVVAVAVDSSEKTDDFVKTGLSTYEIIRQYHFGFVPFIWGLLFPLFVFIAVIFFTSRMASRSEIIAILASGTSFNRMLRPYFIGSVFLALILWMGTRQYIPKANEIKASFQARYLDKNDPYKMGSSNSNSFYRRIDTNTYIGIKGYDTSSKSAVQFFMERLENDKVVYNLRAGGIRWDTAVNKWILTAAVERHIDSLNESISLKLSDTLSISLKPDELRRDNYVKDKLTTPQLIAFIKQEEQRGTEGLNALKVERYRRTATPFAVILLTMIGAIIASRKTRGGSGVHLALGIVIAALFIVSDRFSTVFATNSNLAPWLAAWIPNIVFSIVALRLYKNAPK